MPARIFVSDAAAEVRVERHGPSWMIHGLPLGLGVRVRVAGSSRSRGGARPARQRVRPTVSVSVSVSVSVGMRRPRWVTDPDQIRSRTPPPCCRPIRCRLGGGCPGLLAGEKAMVAPQPEHRRCRGRRSIRCRPARWRIPSSRCPPEYGRPRSGSPVMPVVAEPQQISVRQNGVDRAVAPGRRGDDAVPASADLIWPFPAKAAVAPTEVAVPDQDAVAAQPVK